MEIAQSTDSLEEISEIDPLEIAEMFGNIGGFWGEWFYAWMGLSSLGLTDWERLGKRERKERDNENQPGGGCVRPCIPSN